MVLEEKKIRPLGSIEAVNVDLMVIAATNKKIDKLQVEGSGKTSFPA